MADIKLTNVVKGIQQDLSENNRDGQTYSFALNATMENFSEEQPFPFLSNTPSNFLCYKSLEDEIVIGTLSIHELNKTILAVYNPVTNVKKFIEITYDFIGLGKSDTIIEGCKNEIIERLPQEKIKQTPICKSFTLLETSCFNWNENNPVKFVYKITDCTLNLYWNNCLDEDRFLYFDLLENNELKINDSFLINNGTDCNPEISDILFCDKTKWYPNIDYPCLELSTVSGNKEKGSYYYLVAYSTSSGIPLTNFKSITQPFNVISKGQGVKISVSNLTKDSRYKYLLIVAVETINSITTYHKKTVISVNQTEWVDTENGGQNISAKELFTQYPFYKNSCDLTISNDIMFKSGLEEFEKFNLQPIVNMFEWEWVSIVLKEGDYKRPEIAQNFRSLLRDEVYAFGWQPILDNGEEGPVFPAVGRKKRQSDDILVQNDDVSNNSCVTDLTKRWEIYSTATRDYINPKALPEIYNNCATTEIYESGDFGYYESTEKYPFVPEVWDSNDLGGENLCGQPIRHFKVPDHTVSSHQSNNEYDELNYIFPIGIRIKPSTNINYLLNLAVTKGLITEEQRKRIVGFKIVRANRYGNKSVIAKGLLYDVWQYKRKPLIDYNFSSSCNTNENEYYYPNYPYNDLNDDILLGSDNLHYKGKNLDTNFQKFLYNEEGVEDSKNGFKKRYIFHSPDTHFTQPELGNFLKLEAEVYGKAKGYFNISENFAEEKILSEKHYNIAKIFAQFIASTITTPSEAAITGTAANIGKSIGSAIPGFSNLGGALGELVGGLVGTNVGSNTLSSKIFRNSVILAETEKILNLFKLSGNFRQHHYQHQSVGKYNKLIPVFEEGYKLRNLETKEYIQEGKLTIQEKEKNINFNNSFRESSVYLKTNKTLKNTLNVDNSRTIISKNTVSSEETAVLNNVAGTAKKFKITATEGRFRLDGILCNPYKIGDTLITSEPIGSGSGGPQEGPGEYNSTFIKPKFNINISTECQYNDIKVSEMDNLLGDRPIVVGDLSIEVIEECAVPCTNIVEGTTKYPCKCNEPTERNVASYYSSIKNKVDNQYRTIYDLEWIDTKNCINTLPDINQYKKVLGKKYNCNDSINNVIFMSKCQIQDTITQVSFVNNCEDEINNIIFTTHCNLSNFSF